MQKVIEAFGIGARQPRHVRSPHGALWPECIEHLLQIWREIAERERFGAVARRRRQFYRDIGMTRERRQHAEIGKTCIVARGAVTAHIVDDQRQPRKTLGQPADRRAVSGERQHGKEKGPKGPFFVAYASGLQAAIR